MDNNIEHINRGDSETPYEYDQVLIRYITCELVKPGNTNGWRLQRSFLHETNRFMLLNNVVLYFAPTFSLRTLRNEGKLLLPAVFRNCLIIGTEWYLIDALEAHQPVMSHHAPTTPSTNVE